MASFWPMLFGILGLVFFYFTGIPVIEGAPVAYLASVLAPYSQYLLEENILWTVNAILWVFFVIIPLGFCTLCFAVAFWPEKPPVRYHNSAPTGGYAGAQTGPSAHAGSRTTYRHDEPRTNARSYEEPPGKSSHYRENTGYTFHHYETPSAGYSADDDDTSSDEVHPDMVREVDWNRHFSNAVVCDEDRICPILSINGYERNCNPHHCAMVSVDRESSYEPVPICMFSLILKEADEHRYSDFFYEVNRRVMDCIEENEAIASKSDAMLSELEYRLSQIDEMPDDEPSREPYRPRDYLEAASNRYNQYADGVNRRMRRIL